MFKPNDYQRDKLKNLGAKFEGGVVFLRRFFRAPRQVGSIVPSSSFLAREMVGKVDWDSAETVVELGAGTGVFTRSILKKARPETQVLVFEVDKALQALLRKEHPGIVLYDDAQSLPAILREKGIDKVDYVLSGLPFTVLPHAMTAKILDGVRDCLAGGGKFITFQYSRLMKSCFTERFSNVHATFVPLNVPPAFVYECSNGTKGEARK